MSRRESITMLGLMILGCIIFFIIFPYLLSITSSYSFIETFHIVSQSHLGIVVKFVFGFLISYFLFTLFRKSEKH